MEGKYDASLPSALSAMSIDDGPSRRAGFEGVGGESSDSLVRVVDGEPDHHHYYQENFRQDPRISSPQPPQQGVGSSSEAAASADCGAAGGAGSMPHVTIDDIPPDMREAFLQLDPKQQALALEMLAQQQQQQMEEQFKRLEEHFLTIALNGKRQRERERESQGRRGKMVMQRIHDMCVCVSFINIFI